MGLLDSSCAAGDDGEDERVTISIPGVDGDKDRFRLLIESEMGDMVMAICEAVVLVMFKFKFIFHQAIQYYY